MIIVRRILYDNKIAVSIVIYFEVWRYPLFLQ